MEPDARRAHEAANPIRHGEPLPETEHARADAPCRAELWLREPASGATTQRSLAYL
jgi:hypothetical protein